MRLSLAYEMQRPVVDDHAVIEETIEQCVLADRMGFDTVWFVEHHFLTSFSMSPNSDGRKSVKFSTPSSVTTTTSS